MNKGLIFEIRRFTVHDGPGIRTTVFFKGCPLSCWWCHNPESHRNHTETSRKTLVMDGEAFSVTELTGRWMSVDEVMNEIMQDCIFFEESSGGVTFSGGEPLMQAGFLLDLMKECKSANIHTTLDTSGYADPEMIRMIGPFTDLFLYDLKLVDYKDHIRFTGVSNKLILENLASLVSEDKKMIIRIPVIPGITDTIKNIGDIKRLLAELNVIRKPCSKLNVSLLPYHSLAKNKYPRFNIENKTKELKNLSKESLVPLKEELEEEGLLVKIAN